MNKHNLTSQHLTELLRYDLATGDFFWVASGARMVACHNGEGYLQIKIDNVAYACHRLAWLYVHGAWPAHEIDHINGRRDDNRISNLRDVPRLWNSQNLHKMSKKTKSGLLGVQPLGNGRFNARIKVNGKNWLIGTYYSAQEAHEAYLDAKRALHPGFTGSTHYEKRDCAPLQDVMKAFFAPS